MNIAEIQGAANDAYLKTLGPIDLVPSGHYKAIAAAVAAVAPLLLAELSNEEKVHTWGEYIALEKTASYDRDSKLFKVANALMSNRLASLTAKPDPRVEVVLRELYGDIGAVHAEDRRRVAERLLAALDAVDAARAK